MAWRFRKRIKIFPGIILNFSKSGISATFGVKGASINVGKNGIYVNTGLPGTGLFRRDKVSLGNSPSIYNNTNLKEVDIAANNSFNTNVSSEEARNGLLALIRKKLKEQNDKKLERKNMANSFLSEPNLYDPKELLPNYVIPSTSLLIPFNTVYEAEEQLYSYKNTIVQTFLDFEIELISIKAETGPTITLFTIGIISTEFHHKLSKVEEELSCRLPYKKISIYPTREKYSKYPTLYIECINIYPQIVSMESVINSSSFEKSFDELPCLLGKDIHNKPFIIDLVKIPHLLISGTTGSGKSTLLHCILISLLLKKHPSEIKFILIDGKQVEFNLYNWLDNKFLPSHEYGESIPQNAYEAYCYLSTLNDEIELRIKLIKQANVRNVQEYNNLFCHRKLNPLMGNKYLPYIIVAIDSYSELLYGNQYDFLKLITNISYKGRMTGVHLIISTSRPSNDFLSSELKNNFPGRISFKVTERIDSQITLDTNGAEELDNNGDMLFSYNQQLHHIQGAFIHTAEIERIVSEIYKQNSSPSIEYILASNPNEEDLYNDSNQDYDSLLLEAARLIIINQQASTSMIQRKMNIGYNRAERLMQQLELLGIVGPVRGTSPREVLIDEDTFYELIE